MLVQVNMSDTLFLQSGTIQAKGPGIVKSPCVVSRLGVRRGRAVAGLSSITWLSTIAGADGNGPAGTAAEGAIADI